MIAITSASLIGQTLNLPLLLWGSQFLGGKTWGDSAPGLVCHPPYPEEGAPSVGLDHW